MMVSRICSCELECETILSFDLAFITEPLQEQILDTIIQIKRMLGGLLSRLGWGRIPESSRRAVNTEAASRGTTDVGTGAGSGVRSP